MPMRLDSAGLPFIIGALTLAGLAGALAPAITGSAMAAWIAAVPFVVLGGFFVFFFRDPDRRTPLEAGDDLVLSPADGRVLVAGRADVSAAPEGDWLQVSIFLSPMDVHVNRMPVSGRVMAVKYHPGRFLPAYRADAGDLNEYTEVTIDHHGQPIVVRQIVGILARRIVCRARQGDQVNAGGRFGVMKFGSRMDVFVPTGSTIHTHVGAKVKGGVTVIATLPHP